jgi:hypothetical protein
LTVVPENRRYIRSRIMGAQHPKGTLFGMRDLVVISGGTSTGLQLDQRFSTRRATRSRPAKGTANHPRAAGCGSSP